MWRSSGTCSQTRSCRKIPRNSVSYRWNTHACSLPPTPLQTISAWNWSYRPLKTCSGTQILTSAPWGRRRSRCSGAPWTSAAWRCSSCCCRVTSAISAIFSWRCAPAPAEMRRRSLPVICCACTAGLPNHRVGRSRRSAKARASTAAIAKSSVGWSAAASSPGSSSSPAPTACNAYRPPRPRAAFIPRRSRSRSCLSSTKSRRY